MNLNEKIDESRKFHQMTLPLPANFNPELSSDRLEAVSQWLLDELYATEDDLSRPTDNGYTRGCTTFGRQRNRTIAEALSARHAWLGLPNSNNDMGILPHRDHRFWNCPEIGHDRPE